MNYENYFWHSSSCCCSSINQSLNNAEMKIKIIIRPEKILAGEKFFYRPLIKNLVFLDLIV